MKENLLALLGKMVLGKSTLAKMISGLEVPNKGQVLIDEINTLNKKEFLNIRKKVGIVFQNPENQILFNNVFDDIAFTLKNLKIENYELRIKESLKKLGMEKYLNSENYDLSMGQKQRVTIAGTVSYNPKYLVLDEPTTMIDPQGKEDIYNLIKKLKEENYTIIYITNFIDEILMADRIVVIEDGKIINSFYKKDILNNIDFLKAHGIKIPELVDLVFKLKNKGIELDISNWDKQEIICKILDKM